MAPHQVFTFIVSDDLVAFDFDIMSFNGFVIWFIDCLKMTMLQKLISFLNTKKPVYFMSLYLRIVIFGYLMHHWETNTENTY